jgi:hypothetical protein
MNIERALICPGSAGYQPAAFGSLPNTPGRNSHRAIKKYSRQAAANYGLVPQTRDAPQI